MECPPWFLFAPFNCVSISILLERNCFLLAKCCEGKWPSGFLDWTERFSRGGNLEMAEWKNTGWGVGILYIKYLYWSQIPNCQLVRLNRIKVFTEKDQKNVSFCSLNMQLGQLITHFATGTGEKESQMISMMRTAQQCYLKKTFSWLGMMFNVVPRWNGCVKKHQHLWANNVNFGICLEYNCFQFKCVYLSMSSMVA